MRRAIAFSSPAAALAVLLALQPWMAGCAPPAGGTLARVLEQGHFVWGADAEGGGPYVFPDPGDPEKVTGFEVELAELLAREIANETGRAVAARRFQGDWKTLPDLLMTGRVDVVLNGYEWSPERARLMASTAPYYVYELQLLVRAGEKRITGWTDLGGSPPRRVGVLGGSAAETYLREKYPEDRVQLLLYDGNTDAMGDVTAGKLDATVQDLPIAVFYRRDFPGLVPAGEPAAPGRYVMFTRPEDAAWRDALDGAIRRLREAGELRRLYERYGIWTALQEEPRYLALPELAAERRAGEGALAVLRKHASTFLLAAGMTVFLSVVSMPIAIMLGLLIALGRQYGPRLLAWPLAAYVEVVRGTPLLLQLYVLFFVLPRLFGVALEARLTAILGLALNYAAYEAEIYRAGLQAVPPGQMEAALALGMSRRLALRRIIVPQAVRIVIPPVTNDFIALFKDTSVCSVITVVELTKQYNIAAMNNPADIIPLAALAAALYLAMSYPLSVVAGRMERRLKRS